MAVVVWVDPDTDGGVVISGFPVGSALNSSKFTFSGTLTPGPLANDILQVRVTLDPKGCTLPSTLLDSITDIGAGTAINYKYYF